MMPPNECDHTDAYGSAIMEGGPYSKHPGIQMCIICDQAAPFLAVVGDPVSPLRLLGEVVEAFEAAKVDVRDAYWGFGHWPSDGDRELVILVDGVEHHVVTVVASPGGIVVEVAKKAVLR